MSDLPLVSIIIPCYNQGHYLSEAIDSALAQTYPHVEIIVVNDGSTDDTRQVAERYGNKIIYIEKENKGPSIARKIGLQNAHGEWIQFLDADDLIDSDKIKKQLSVVDHEQIGCVYNGWKNINDDGKCISMYLPHLSLSDPISALLSGNVLSSFHAVLIRRSALDSAGGIDENITWYEDWDLWFRIAFYGWKFVLLPEYKSSYRLHNENRSNQNIHMLKQSFPLLDKMANLIQSNAVYVHIIKETRSRTCLMLSYTYFTFQNDTEQSRYWAEKAFSEQENIFPICTELWTAPILSYKDYPSEIKLRLQHCDKWADKIILPRIHKEKQRSEFYADYQLWIVQSLFRNGFITKARDRMLPLLASGAGISRLWQNQKSFVVKILFGEKFAHFVSLLNQKTRIV